MLYIVNAVTEQLHAKMKLCEYSFHDYVLDGVAFEDLPDDWKCPRCKQGKDKYNKA